MTETLLAGRYRLEEQIASGGMGAVWRATDVVLQRPVAIKLLHEHLADHPGASERFRREALTAASLSHPNMANVFDYIEAGDRPGIVMELVESETLAQRLRRGRLPIEEAVRVAGDVLAALEAAHRAGVVHRDIKPGNILLSRDGRVKVTDLGIARSLGDSTLTQTGAIMGTPHYASPEQLHGASASPLTDQYALGIVLYEMLTGARPFDADTPVAIAMMRLNHDPVPPRTLRPAIAAGLNAVVMRALARDPQDRFPSARAMREALGDADAGTRTQVLPVATDDPTIAFVPTQSTPRRAAPRLLWRRLALWVLPVLAASALVVSVVWLLGRPTYATVPSLHGATLTQATHLTASVGLRLRIKRVTNDASRDRVLTQTPAAGARVESDAAIAITVSNGPPPCCDVPDVRGMRLDDARAALEGAGLRVGEVRYGFVPGGEAGTVTSQSTDPGRRLDGDGRVDLTIQSIPRREPRRKGRNKD